MPYDICFLKEKLYTESVASYKQNVVISGENSAKNYYYYPLYFLNFLKMNMYFVLKQILNLES